MITKGGGYIEQRRVLGSPTFREQRDEEDQEKIPERKARKTGRNILEVKKVFQGRRGDQLC